MSFANLKKQSSLGSLTSKLVNEVEKMNKTGGGGDDRLWKPELDKTGNGYAVIRFLPAPDGEDLPWAKIYTHAFQGPGGWYIENSLTTLNQKDPVSEYNRERHRIRCVCTYLAFVYLVIISRQVTSVKLVSHKRNHLGHVGE